MSKQFISSGSEFEKKIGYSRAIVEGEWVFVSGTTGYNYASMSISDNVVEQAEQCFQNIAQALQEAGCTLDHVVRVRYIYSHSLKFRC